MRPGRNGNGSRRARADAPRLPPASFPEPRGRLTLPDGTPCVILAEKDFERMFDQLEAYELTARSHDPDSELIAYEDFKAQLAASQLAAARKARGLTQVQLARRLGLPQSQISRIERNPDRTTVRTMKKIAAALKVNV